MSFPLLLIPFQEGYYFLRCYIFLIPILISFSLGGVGGPRNPEEWDMTASTVNAYYDPTRFLLLFIDFSMNSSLLTILRSANYGTGNFFEIYFNIIVEIKWYFLLHFYRLLSLTTLWLPNYNLFKSSWCVSSPLPPPLSHSHPSSLSCRLYYMCICRCVLIVTLSIWRISINICIGPRIDSWLWWSRATL